MKRDELEKISLQYLNYLNYSDRIYDAFKSKNIYTRILCQLYLVWINDYNTEYALINTFNKSNIKIYKKSYSFPDWKILLIRRFPRGDRWMYFIKEDVIFKLDLDQNNIWDIRNLFIKFMQFIEKRYINNVI